MAKQTRYLFYDTELSGCEQIVSIGYILTDTEGNTIDEDYYIVKPYKKISKSTIAIHGITTQQAKAEGITLRRAIARFINAAKAASVLIGYAPQNDILALSIGCRHLHRDVFFDDGEAINLDVARMAAKYMLERGEILPGQTPSLEHIHERLSDGAEFAAHNALDDAKATARCFFELMRMGYFCFDAILPYARVKHISVGRQRKPAVPTEAQPVDDSPSTPDTSTPAETPDNPETPTDTVAVDDIEQPAPKKKKHRRGGRKKKKKNEAVQPTADPGD